MRKYFKAALENISKYGDTDIFPFPIENFIFYDKIDDVLEILKNIHKNFDESLKNYPVIHESNLTVVGYTGFRWGTQIDPIWNAYLLSLVLSIGEEIESERISQDKKVVFSYRYKLDREEKTIFNRDFGWIQFQKRSLELAEHFNNVLICDISDFYPRVYHHRLENALKKLTSNKEVVRRIMELLSRISKGVSYGLPVGGPAARLLCEILLNRVDRLLLSDGITFCRFVDDYHVFTKNMEEAYSSLIFLNEKLSENEGLSIQKNKTKIINSKEFISTSEFIEKNMEEEDDFQVDSRSFLSLHLHFDPYSDTAIEDYEELREEIDKFDIVGMLAKEMQKSRIHQVLTKKLVKAVKFLNQASRNAAILSLLENLNILYPIFSNVMILLKDILDELNDRVQEKVFLTLRNLINNESYLIRVPVNLAFAIRVLAEDKSDETDEILSRIYKQSTSMIIKRDIILIMAKRNADYWISDRRKQYHVLNPWEKRSLIITSYILEDEGSHWRKQIKNELSLIDDLAMKWAAEKKNSGNWEIPI